MKKTLLFFLWSVISTIIFSQKNNTTTYQDYFQQEVNYDIEVTLDDENHILKGVANIEYINNSPDELDSIYFHLWANAYKNQQTAFAKQKIQSGATDFFFAKKDEMGGYTQVDFSVNNESVNWSYDEKNIDIVLLKLNKTLKPNQSIQIRIIFEIKIPKYFSRMGHRHQAYYMAQWYPKPAVYDRAGWHPMPYLEYGEYYSEFGKFEVKITLPKNYVVAATGDLQTETEKAFLIKRVRATNKFAAKNYPVGLKVRFPLTMPDTFPASSSQLKTIEYTAENVHDFAWFADKRFFVQKNRVQVGATQNVDTWAFFNLKEFHLWMDATKYLNQSITFYSQKVGMYPYSHATAVNNPYAAAGAMEYPMITLVDKMYSAEVLDIVIAHEVGHNWFYGILGFNERDYPWLDEGINSYYERWYTRTFYPDKTGQEYLPGIFQSEGALSAEELATVSMMRENMHQAISTPIEEMTEMNYGLGSYDRTAELLNGRITPRKMKGFFKQWKFKHPQPKDFIQYFDLDNDKAFEMAINTTEKIDYKIVSVSKSGGYQLKIKNKGKIPESFELAMIMDGKTKNQKVDGFIGGKIIEITVLEEGEKVNKFIIDKDRKIADLNRRNNQIRTSGMFKKLEPMQLKFLMGLENPTRTTLSWLPAVGWNNYDKTMVGLLLHNYDFGVKNFEFAVAPMYAFATKKMVGTGVVKWNIFPENSLFQRVTLSLRAKHFSYQYNWRHSFYNEYTKFSPQLEFNFRKKKMTSHLQHRLSFRHVNILLNRGQTGIDTPDVTRDKKRYYVNELKYIFENSKATAPLLASLTVHQGEGILKIFANAKQVFPYRKNGKGLTLTGFAGWLPTLDNPPAKVSFVLGGRTERLSLYDYMIDETLLGRTQGRGSNSEVGADGIFSQQIYKRDAGFKTLSAVGGSEDWMVGLGISTTIPGPLPLRPYIDTSISQEYDGVKFSFSSGVAIVAIPDVLEIYLPFFESKNITESLDYDIRNTYLKRISFLIDIQNLKKTGKEMVAFY